MAPLANLVPLLTPLRSADISEVLAVLLVAFWLVFDCIIELFIYYASFLSLVLFLSFSEKRRKMEKFLGWTSGSHQVHFTHTGKGNTESEGSFAPGEEKAPKCDVSPHNIWKKCKYNPLKHLGKNQV